MKIKIWLFSKINTIIITMPVDISYDYIAFFQKLEDVLPYKQMKSGAKAEDNAIYSDNSQINTNPILRLEYDILNKDGYGLRRGFYEIRPDSEYTYLMFIQAGKVKAKIPVISTELISKYGNDYEWQDKKKKKDAPNSNPVRLSDSNNIVSPKKITPILTDREKKKRERKYKKGIDPIEHIHSTVKMEYDKELSSYIVIWEKYNTRIVGQLKTE